MRRKLAFVFVVAVVGSMLAGARLADAHQCPEPKHEGKVSRKDECHETRAVADGALFVGAGTRQTDAGFKLTGDDSLLTDLIGADPQERSSGVWGFRIGG